MDQPASASPSPIDPKWEQRYQSGDTPWDVGIPSRELTRLLDTQPPAGPRALELGCGTGTNAVFLANRGYEVTAIDGAPLAIRQAEERAERAGVTVRWITADVTALPALPELAAPFDFVFDRGCYHVVRSIHLAGYLETLERVTRPGTRLLLLTGNAHEQRDKGPPGLYEEEIRRELGPLFRFDDLHPFRFDDPAAATGPLGWSCLLTRL